MSQEKVEWAIGLPLKDRTMKLVMIQLCDAWTEQGGCFPSIGRLAARSAASERSVQRALRRLEIKGLVARGFTGRTTRYALNFKWTDPRHGDGSEVTDCVTTEPSECRPVNMPPGDIYAVSTAPFVTSEVTPDVTLTIEPIEEPKDPPVAPPREDLFDEQAGSDDPAALGMGTEVRQPAEAISGQPASGRNGKARRASVGLTLEHAAEAGLLAKRCACDDARDAWDAAAGRSGLAKVQLFGPPRRKAVEARLGELGGLEGWTAMLEIVEATPFLLGDNDRGWRADFDWILKPANLTKVMEKKYERAEAKSGLAAVLDACRDYGLGRTGSSRRPMEPAGAPAAPGGPAGGFADFGGPDAAGDGRRPGRLFRLPSDGF